MRADELVGIEISLRRRGGFQNLSDRFKNIEQEKLVGSRGRALKGDGFFHDMFTEARPHRFLINHIHPNPQKLTQVHHEPAVIE